MNFVARLAGNGAPSFDETVSIKNISGHGARVITSRPLHVRDHVVLVAASGGFHVAGEVVYCERLSADRCAVGLRFPSGVESD